MNLISKLKIDLIYSNYVYKNFFNFFFSLFSECLSDQIIKNAAGDFYLLKNDGSYKKLPPPKPGHTYKIIKKIKIIQPFPKNQYFLE